MGAAACSANRRTLHSPQALLARSARVSGPLAHRLILPVDATRDVAITKLAVPQSARVHQTKTITIGLENNRGSEMSLPHSRTTTPSWDFIGQSTQLVPGKSKNRTTSFVFSYTFTPEDATIGKVTFRAVASVNAGRDALPGDNELIAPPTTVNP